jgi:hypothetical protein
MLINPPFQFSRQVDNLTGTPPAATVGTNFTAAANSGSNGTDTAVLSALAFDCYYFIIGIGGITGANVDGRASLDVRHDPAGGTSWATLISALVCGYSAVPAAGVTGIGFWYHFPLFIPAGTSLGVRSRTSHTSNITSGRVVMYCYGCPNRPDMWWCGSAVESLGISALSSTGTSHTPGNSGAFSSYASVGSVTTRRYGAIQFGVNGSDASSLAIGYYWEMGYGSNKLPGSPTFYNSSTTGEVTARTGFGQPIFCDIPAGTQMQCRATGSGTAEAYSVAMYGVY